MEIQGQKNATNVSALFKVFFWFRCACGFKRGQCGRASSDLGPGEISCQTALVQGDSGEVGEVRFS